MATYTAESPTETGLIAAQRSPANGDKIPGGVTLVITNNNAGSLTLTITTPQTVHGDLTVADRTVTVATTQVAFVRIPNDSTYVSASDGLVTLATWSVTSSVTYAVIGS
jgi:hypothetical protein